MAEDNQAPRPHPKERPDPVRGRHIAEDDPLPSYYRPGEVKAMLDKLRRRYRWAMLKLVMLQVTLIVPIRWVADFFTASVPEFFYLRPMILPAIAGLALLGWISGILVIFHRSRMIK